MYAAGIGDALGVPGEAYSKKEILDAIGCRIEKFYEPGDNIYGAGNVAGEVTDDTSQMYEMIKQIIATKGEFTVEAAAKGLINWTENWPKYYPRNAGPTMKSWTKEYLEGEDPLTLGMKGKAYGRGISDGCAMRVDGSGLLNPGDWDGAVQTAITMTSVSHGTQHAYSGACAIAVAIAEALTEDADVHSVVKAAIYGAKKGEEIGLQTARVAYGCRVLPKMLEAIKLGYSASTPEEAEKLIEDNIGATGDIQDAVAIVMGLIVANDGDVMNTLISCANFGGDTDTFACIAGQIVGALHGKSAIPSDFIKQFEEANPKLDFEWAGEELIKIIHERREK
jgi:ADP-ribosylglycohydrolase